MNPHILKKPLISEKSFAGTTNNKFTFIVTKKAMKEEIKEVVEELFKVTVLDINTVSVQGKVKRSKKGLGKRSDYKKAICTLKKGDKIDLFEIETEETAEDKKKEVKEKK